MELAEQAKKLVILATENDEYEVALEALAIAKTAAKHGGDTEMLASMSKTQAWLEAANRAYGDVSKAESRLLAQSERSARQSDRRNLSLPR